MTRSDSDALQFISLEEAAAMTTGTRVTFIARVRDLRRFADALARTFPVRNGWRDDLGDATVVCRCEEVSAGRIREAIDDLGATDARAVKLLTRAGMGWCQGRICSPAVDALCPSRGTPQQVAAASRPLAVPVPLRALANYPDERITP